MPFVAYVPGFERSLLRERSSHIRRSAVELLAKRSDTSAKLKYSGFEGSKGATLRA